MLASLPPGRRIALKSFLKRWHGNAWMQDQRDWLEDACLIASCESVTFNAKRILYCAKHGLFCGHPNFCRRCNLDRRVQPALDEYGGCFPDARYWYVAVVGTKMRSDRAGLYFGELERLPYRDLADGFPLHACPLREGSFDRLCRALFELIKVLNKLGVIGGAFCHLEFHLAFSPDDIRRRYDYWSGLDHSLQPHLNVLFNMRAPITEGVATGMYDLLERLLVHHRAQLGYPNLWLKQVDSQEKLNGWLRYGLKSWPLATWYRRALKRGCNAHLNLLFDEIVFENLSHLARRFASPRKFGNMNCLCRSVPYIGAKPPMKLSQKQVSLWLKSKVFAAQHPDWEDSVFAILEKRRRRRGQGRPES
jgi:hypothetical protein